MYNTYSFWHAIQLVDSRSKARNDTIIAGTKFSFILVFSFHLPHHIFVNLPMYKLKYKLSFKVKIRFGSY